MQPQFSKEVIIFFIAANIIVVGAAIFFFLILRIQHKRKRLYQKQLLEKEYETREESFLQIARDLHDDIGSSLSGINMFSQLAQEELAKPKNGSANELLQKINTYTTEVIEKVSDMAWLLKPNNESLQILIKKLKIYNNEPALLKNITLHFDSIPQIPGKGLTIQQRKTIFLVSKEAINNALKYSACKNIFYKLESTSNKIRLIIKDDGSGFSVSETNNGNGLSNMKARADEIGGSLTIQTQPAGGTCIILEFNPSIEGV
jgi:signal transduction histidine kinase